MTNKEQVQQAGSAARLPLTPHLGKLFLFVLMAGILFYGVLSLVKPQYRASALVKIDQGAGGHAATKAISAQIKTLSSKKFVSAFTRKEGLHNDPEFNEVLAPKGPLSKALALVGLSKIEAASSNDDRVADRFLDQFSLKAWKAPQTYLLGIKSHDPQKAARLANAIAGQLVTLVKAIPDAAKLGPEKAGRTTPLGQDKRQENTIEVLSAQIAADEGELVVLEKQIAKALQIEKQRAEAPPVSGLPEQEKTVDSVTGVELTKEQLSELASQFILARAKRGELEMQAKLLRDKLEKDGTLQGDIKHLDQGELGTALAKQAHMARRISDLSATLLPSHPTLKRFKQEKALLDDQVAAEAKKVVAKLETDAKIAAARELSLKESLGRFKQELDALSNTDPAAMAVMPLSQETVGQKPDQSDLGAGLGMQNAGVPSRDLLQRRESLFARIAAGRTELLQAQKRPQAQTDEQARPLTTGGTLKRTPHLTATIVQKAEVPGSPVFPKKKEITLFAMLAALILGSIALLLGRFPGQMQHPLDRRPVPTSRPQKGFADTGGQGAKLHQQADFSRSVS